MIGVASTLLAASATQPGAPIPASEFAPLVCVVECVRDGVGVGWRVAGDVWVGDGLADVRIGLGFGFAVGDAGAADVLSEGWGADRSKGAAT
ncbi:MAG: hypothetical protein ACJ735_12710 [Actinomycetes bacterium]